MESCCAEVALCLALLPGALAAQAPAPTAVSAEFAARVAARVAETWQVSAEAVTLSWGSNPPADLPADAPFVLAGRGADGWFSVVITPDPVGRVVALRVRAGVPETATVAARPLAAGITLAPGDLRAETRVHWGPGPTDTRWAAPGWDVRRAIRVGEPVAWPAAEAPYVIVAGQTVRVAWRRGVVELWRDGVALHAARAGEMVRVRLDRSADRLVGRAAAQGVVVLDQGGTP